jgi:hypothetical protein
MKLRVSVDQEARAYREDDKRRQSYKKTPNICIEATSGIQLSPIRADV